MTRRCPLTYAPLEGNEKYSSFGLKLLSTKLAHLEDLPLSAAELRQEALRRSDKMSIQGVQPKLSAILNIKEGRFTIVDNHGKFILKPPLEDYTEVPANEDLSIRLASLLNIEAPLHGLIYNNDRSLTYFIKRFDRAGHKDKIAVEDFAQLAGKTRDTKYNFSMEKITAIIDKYCTFPMLEKNKFFTRVLFNYLIGNEDMHLKNFSVICRNNKVELAPAYDFLNTTILLGSAREQIALPLNGKKNNLTRKDFINYYAAEHLQLNQPVITQTLNTIELALPKMQELIEISFLSEKMKGAYKKVFSERVKALH